MLIEISCWKCNTIFETEYSDEHVKYKGRKPKRMCSQCRALFKQQRSDFNKSEKLRHHNSKRMKANNPMHDAIARAKMVTTKTGVLHQPEDCLEIKKNRRKETKSEMSERMKNANPMHDYEIKARRRDTYISRRTLGLIVYKKGPDHHLWKGNLDFNNSCRRSLYPVWTKPILIRDGFKCTRCESGSDLQVHHLIPLHTLIEQVRIRHNIRSFSELSGHDFHPFVEEVISLHTMEMGITLCRRCHGIEDPLFTLS